MGLQFAKVLAPYGLYFLEEPCWPESIEGLRAIKAAAQMFQRKKHGSHGWED